MIHSKALIYADFNSKWYKHWAKKLKQTNANRGGFELKANKFWQNAIIAESLYERGALSSGNSGLGFGVGAERLPALFASLGVKVSATDQDYKTAKASYWENGQLAHGAKSLNAEAICSPKLFAQNVSYRAVNMNSVPKDLKNYDFLWSNCALGHLGSIDKSLKFITDSLNCLKPGGWAVHTTEANILSNDETLDNSNTVFFRQRDLLKLFKSLSRQGYLVSSLNFKLARSDEDKRFTLLPKWGTDHSKILFDGYMATQIVIIIQRPKKPIGSLRIKINDLKHTAFYYKNLFSMFWFKLNNQELSGVIKYNQIFKNKPAEKLSIQPQESNIKLKAKAGTKNTVSFEYKNNSESGLFKLHGCFYGSQPLVLATADPINRESKLSNDQWYSKNRPSIKLLKTASPDKLEEVEYVKPGEVFNVSFDVTLPKLKPGTYIERFGLVKEGGGFIPGTETELKITSI